MDCLVPDICSDMSDIAVQSGRLYEPDLSNTMSFLGTYHLYASGFPIHKEIPPSETKAEKAIPESDFTFHFQQPMHEQPHSNGIHSLLGIAASSGKPSSAIDSAIEPAIEPAIEIEHFASGDTKQISQELVTGSLQKSTPIEPHSCRLQPTTDTTEYFPPHGHTEKILLLINESLRWCPQFNIPKTCTASCASVKCPTRYEASIRLDNNKILVEGVVGKPDKTIPGRIVFDLLTPLSRMKELWTFDTFSVSIFKKRTGQLIIRGIRDSADPIECYTSQSFIVSTPKTVRDILHGSSNSRRKIARKADLDFEVPTAKRQCLRASDLQKN